MLPIYFWLLFGAAPLVNDPWFRVEAVLRRSLAEGEQEMLSIPLPMLPMKEVPPLPPLPPARP